MSTSQLIRRRLALRELVEIFLNSAKYLEQYFAQMVVKKKTQKTFINENHQIILQKLQRAFQDGSGR